MKKHVAFGLLMGMNSLLCAALVLVSLFVGIMFAPASWSITLTCLFGIV